MATKTIVGVASLVLIGLLDVSIYQYHKVKKSSNLLRCLPPAEINTPKVQNSKVNVDTGLHTIEDFRIYRDMW